MSIQSYIPIFTALKSDMLIICTTYMWHMYLLSLSCYYIVCVIILYSKPFIFFFPYHYHVPFQLVVVQDLFSILHDLNH